MKMGFRTLSLLGLHLLSTSALQIANIGSSYAAGPGIPSNPGNYAHILASRLNASLADIAVSGSTLSGIAPQIAKIPTTSDIVLITSGGNDLNYVGSLSMDSNASNLSETQLADRYANVLSKINARAPKATIYVAEYLTILGPDAQAGAATFSASRLKYHQGTFDTLEKATAAAAAKSKAFAVLVPVSKASEGHGLGSSVPWANGRSVPAGAGGVAWHPNTAGMKAVAEMIYGKVKERSS
ncbi:SGNH hydrolase [Microthyrium microscopicum]|uniref:SGNH hydrolase n=1 Tax=Microthyrium microscopicum TaxID=703497 RepID=A0A6A6TY00_9PEZI|nr:SGNH hydrolase [Microthyrium microscopicum]